MAMNRKSGLYSLLVTAILLAVGIVLPFLTGNVQVLGQAISPLHIPVLICGLTCGWCWGMGLGIVLPLLRKWQRMARCAGCSIRCCARR